MLVAGLAALLCPALGRGRDEPPPEASTEGASLFREQVLAILDANCSDCHGGAVAEPEGGLRIVSRESLLAGGASGPAIVPGAPDRSLLIRAVRHEVPDLEMPFDGRLQEAEIAALARWVELGAPWPADTRPEPRAGEAAFARPSGAAASPELLYFEQEIRPLLESKCFNCHGPATKTSKGGLRMSGREALLAGGDRGPALVPGDAEASLLIRAVRYADTDLKMPPRTKLDAADVQRLEHWVALGAPWPDWEGPIAAVEAAPGMAERIAAGRTEWAFAALPESPPPAVHDTEWVTNEIDAFVLARLEAAGLEPSGEASPRELVRRAYFDLIGLPPTLAEVERFESDPSPEAWNTLIDDLLARPEHGERWARHWLDVVRYGETNGYERDLDKPFAWRYRDWVVDALNADKPYDRFVAEQLAGDELQHGSEAERQQALIATGFWRIGPWDDEPADPLQARYDELDDGLRVVGEGLLGLTVGCARCHDHKFDPIGQEDYYGMLAFLGGLQPYELPRFSPESAVLAPLDADGKAVPRWKQQRETVIARLDAEYTQLFQEGLRRLLEERMQTLSPAVQAAFRKPESERTREERLLVQRTKELHPDDNEIRKKLSREDLKRASDLFGEIEAAKQSFPGDFDWGLVARESGRDVPPMHVLGRGLATIPGDEVEAHFLPVLCRSDEDAIPVAIVPPADGSSSGRRRALAEWIASPSNPLTARVIVNRVWQHHFGRGIVPTPNDFGSTGVPPTHPELLDWLAADFVSHGWSLKRLHAQILGSSTWRMSSHPAPGASQARALELDPANELLWRQNPRRLEAEALRDAMLSVAGILSARRGGPSFYPQLSREALASASRPGAGWLCSPPEEQRRRSLYACVKRGMLVPMFVDFDYVGAAFPTGARPVTTLPTQALTLLNSDFAGEIAHTLAQRAMPAAGGDSHAALARLFEFAHARAASAAELELLANYVQRQSTSWSAVEGQIVIQPRVPTRLAEDFLAQAAGTDILSAPREGWRVLPGTWGTGYNDTKEQDPMRGPAALAVATAGAMSVEAAFCVDADCEMAGLLLLAAPVDATFAGLELAFLARENAVELRVHGAPGTAVGVLARAPATLAAGARHEVRFAVESGTAQAELDGARLITAELPADVATARGSFGARAVGGALRLTDCVASTASAALRVEPDDAGTPEFRALRSAALILLNSNEFAYVD